jgi:hypothetical protein
MPGDYRRSTGVIVRAMHQEMCRYGARDVTELLTNSRCARRTRAADRDGMLSGDTNNDL